MWAYQLLTIQFTAEKHSCLISMRSMLGQTPWGSDTNNRSKNPQSTDIPRPQRRVERCAFAHRLSLTNPPATDAKGSA